MNTSDTILRPSDAAVLRTYGKSELASRYFPALSPKSAWKKLRFLMLEYDDLVPLANMPRRIFTPRETALIFATLGSP